MSTLPSVGITGPAASGWSMIAEKHAITREMGRASALSSFFFQAGDGIRDHCVTGVQTCALPISPRDLDADLLGAGGRAEEKEGRGRTPNDRVARGAERTSRSACSVRPHLPLSRVKPAGLMYRGALLFHLLHRLAHLPLILRLGQVLEADHADRLLLVVADQEPLDLVLLHQLAGARDVVVGPHEDHFVAAEVAQFRGLRVESFRDDANRDVPVGHRPDRATLAVHDRNEAD